MIELKLDGHTVFQLDVVSQYKDRLRQQDALRNEHLTEIANLRDERDALKTHNTMLRVCLKNIIKVADRKTDEFDAAKAALEKS